MNRTSKGIRCQRRWTTTSAASPHIRLPRRCSREIATIDYQPGIVIDQDTDLSGRCVLDDGGVRWLSTTGEGGMLADHGYRSASW